MSNSTRCLLTMVNEHVIVNGLHVYFPCSEWAYLNPFEWTLAALAN